MEYRIEQLARAGGVAVETIRFYQGKGLLEAPRRAGRVTWYSEGHLDRLRRIPDLQQRGFTLTVIRRFLEGELEESDEALVEAVTAPTPPETLSLDELAIQSGVAKPLLRALEQAGLIFPTSDGDEPRYPIEDLEALAAGLKVVGGGPGARRSGGAAARPDGAGLPARRRRRGDCPARRGALRPARPGADPGRRGQPGSRRTRAPAALRRAAGSKWDAGTPPLPAHTPPRRTRPHRARTRVSVVELEGTPDLVELASAARDAGHEVTLIERPMPDAVSLVGIGRRLDLVSNSSGVVLEDEQGNQLDEEPGLDRLAAARRLWARVG